VCTHVCLKESRLKVCECTSDRVPEPLKISNLFEQRTLWVRLTVAAATHDHAVLRKADAVGESGSLFRIGNKGMLKVRLLVSCRTDDLEAGFLVKKENDLAAYRYERKARIGPKAPFAGKADGSAWHSREARSDLRTRGIER
jgi:hypothetical protein